MTTNDTTPETDTQQAKMIIWFIWGLASLALIGLILSDGGPQMLADQINEIEIWALLLVAGAMFCIIKITYAGCWLWAHTAPQRRRLLNKLRDHYARRTLDH